MVFEYRKAIILNAMVIIFPMYVLAPYYTYLSTITSKNSLTLSQQLENTQNQNHIKSLITSCISFLFSTSLLISSNFLAQELYFQKTHLHDSFRSLATLCLSTHSLKYTTNLIPLQRQ